MNYRRQTFAVFRVERRPDAILRRLSRMTPSPHQPADDEQDDRRAHRAMRDRFTPQCGMSTPSVTPSRDPLHGLTLEAIVTALVERYGWPGLGERVPVRCFQVDPSIGSSLKFLRRTPWARAKVESLYLFMLRDLRRGSAG